MLKTKACGNVPSSLELMTDTGTMMLGSMSIAKMIAGIVIGMAILRYIMAKVSSVTNNFVLE